MAVEARNYRTLASREPVVVLPEVAAWRRSAQTREQGRKAVALVTTGPRQSGPAVSGVASACKFAGRRRRTGPFAAMGVVAFTVGAAAANPYSVGAGVLMAAFGITATVSKLRRARWERVARIVLRWERPQFVPRRTHWNGGALALHWPAILARADALGVENPEVFLAIASDEERWFSVGEGLAVFGALAKNSLTGAPEQADLARLVDVLGAKESARISAEPEEEPLRFRLEYVDASDGRSDDELFASGYCVALAGER